MRDSGEWRGGKHVDRESALRPGGLMGKAKAKSLIPIERIAARIFVIRGEQVMLDRDLAKLYEVKAIALRQQVKRNSERFPDDFMFQLSEEEVDALVSQNVIPSRRSLGGSLPYAFTQEGVAMLSSVLRSRQAAEINVLIMRTYVQLRKAILTNDELARIVAEHDQIITTLCEQVDWLLAPPESERKDRIGFRVTDDE